MTTASEYYIATFENCGGAFNWRWELRRHSSPMGVKLGAGGYQTQAAAERAGQEALATLLQKIELEARRKK